MLSLSTVWRPAAALWLLLAAGPAAASSLCMPAIAMSACCQATIKSLTESIGHLEADMSWECWKELDLAIEQTRDEKFLNTCAPKDYDIGSTLKSFVRFLETHPEFNNRSPRFVFLRLLELKWPCQK